MNKISLKTPEEISTMQRGGKILSEVIRKVLDVSVEGVTLLELDSLAEKTIRGYGAKPSFQMVRDYKWTVCACVNDVVVHGVPSDYRLKNDDVLGIDCGVFLDGFHTDSAWSIIVGNKRTYPPLKTISVNTRDLGEAEKFLLTGRKALERAIKQVKAGNYIFDISQKIEEEVKGNGYSVVKSLVGHGVGRELHEAPEIPGYVKTQRIQTPEIKPGMVLAVEVIYNMGGPEVIYKGNDGWTIASEDGTISGLFEATVAVTSHGSYVLTEL